MRAMNKPRTPFLLTAAIPVLLATLPACAQEEAGADNGDEAPVAETWDEKASYALGGNIGSNLDPEDLTLDADLVLRGFMDALEGTEAMESEEIDSVLGELSTKMQEHADRARKAAMMENTAKSAAFLAAKAGEDGIVKTDSGLLYREIRPGEGDSPAATQAVTVNYRGTLIDGTQFDSSYDRGQPATFPVGGVLDTCPGHGRKIAAGKILLARPTRRVRTTRRTNKDGWMWPLVGRRHHADPTDAVVLVNLSGRAILPGTRIGRIVFNAFMRKRHFEELAIVRKARFGPGFFDNGDHLTKDLLVDIVGRGLLLRLAVRQGWQRVVLLPERSDPTGLIAAGKADKESPFENMIQHRRLFGDA